MDAKRHGQRRRLSRSMRQLIAHPPQHNYVTRQFQSKADRDALYHQLKGRIAGLVKHSDVTSAGTVYSIAWPRTAGAMGQGLTGNGMGTTPANSDTTRPPMVPTHQGNSPKNEVDPVYIEIDGVGTGKMLEIPPESVSI